MQLTRQLYETGYKELAKDSETQESNQKKPYLSHDLSRLIDVMIYIWLSKVCDRSSLPSFKSPDEVDPFADRSKDFMG